VRRLLVSFFRSHRLPGGAGWNTSCLRFAIGKASENTDISRHCSSSYRVLTRQPPRAVTWSRGIIFYYAERLDVIAQLTDRAGSDVLFAPGRSRLFAVCEKVLLAYE